MITSQSAGIRIVSPSEFDAATAQTPGSQRLAAISRSGGIETGLWGGLFTIPPGGRIDVHHHGMQETIVYVLEGTSHVRWGERGEFSATAHAGDFIHVPPWLPHMESNPSDTIPVRWVVIRSTPEPIVVHLPGIWDAVDRR